MNTAEPTAQPEQSPESTKIPQSHWKKFFEHAFVKLAFGSLVVGIVVLIFAFFVFGPVVSQLQVRMVNAAGQLANLEQRLSEATAVLDELDGQIKLGHQRLEEIRTMRSVAEQASGVAGAFAKTAEQVVQQVIDASREVARVRDGMVSRSDHDFGRISCTELRVLGAVKLGHNAVLWPHEHGMVIEASRVSLQGRGSDQAPSLYVLDADGEGLVRLEIPAYGTGMAVGRVQVWERNNEHAELSPPRPQDDSQ